MSRRPRIHLDVDGPLTTGFFEISCDLLRAYGVDAWLEKIDRWDIFAAFDTPPEIVKAVRAKLRRPGVATSFEPLPGARPFVDELRAWADVYAVTAPLDGSQTWAYEREAWLGSVLGFAPDRVISARDKRVVVGDAFVDDKHEHLVEWSSEHPAGLALMWDETHNRAEPWRGPRVRGYDELRAYLEVLRR